MGQIISNSVKYAVKDTAPAIQFSVTDNPESGQITLSVSDNGTGIPASDLPFVLIRASLGTQEAFKPLHRYGIIFSAENGKRFSDRFTNHITVVMRNNHYSDVPQGAISSQEV